MYPLRFAPIFKRYLWGGRRLSSLLGKRIGPEDDYAESWEIVDRQLDQSLVVDGSLAGKSLHELMESSGRQLLGPQPWQAVSQSSRPPSLQGRFPLLLKFLDAHQMLSVQVHPNDQQALAQIPPDLGKTEAWYVLDAQPESLIYAGLQPGVDRGDVERAVERGAFEQVLHRFHPQVGDCILVPAGTVHAIGSGLVLVEIQQSSDTTYRLFDWNRVDASGKPRPLHIEQALNVIDYAAGPVAPQHRATTGLTGATELVACDKFCMRLWNLTESTTIELQQRFRILTVVHGELQIDGQPTPQPLVKGQTTLIPACLEAVAIQPLKTPCHFLDITVP